MELLATQPYSGRAREDLMPNLRNLVMNNFVAFYRVEADEIVIIRILHGRQNQFPDRFDLADDHLIQRRLYRLPQFLHRLAADRQPHIARRDGIAPAGAAFGRSVDAAE